MHQSNQSMSGFKHFLAVAMDTALEFSEAEPTHWHPAVAASWWYRASPIAFSFLGAHVLCSLDALHAHSPVWFPWKTVGLELLLQAVLSYMADVHTWGRRSMWKNADAIGACTMVLVAVCSPFLQLAGWTTYPSGMAMTFITVIIAALFCKRASSSALRAGRLDPRNVDLCNRFLKWHTAWHLLVPIGGSVSISML
jgi:hypothetical protein